MNSTFSPVYTTLLVPGCDNHSLRRGIIFALISLSFWTVDPFLVVILIGSGILAPTCRNLTSWLKRDGISKGQSREEEISL